MTRPDPTRRARNQVPPDANRLDPRVFEHLLTRSAGWLMTHEKNPSRFSPNSTQRNDGSGNNYLEEASKTKGERTCHEKYLFTTKDLLSRYIFQDISNENYLFSIFPTKFISRYFHKAISYNSVPETENERFRIANPVWLFCRAENGD